MKTKELQCFYDIERTPHLGWFHPPLYQTNILKVERYSTLLSFSWAFSDGKTLGKIHHLQLSDFPARFKNDRWDDTDLTIALHRTLGKAYNVMAHNGDNFDNKVANTYFLKHGLDPLPEYKTVDTLKSARRHFKFASNKLGEIGKELGIGTKTEVGVNDVWYPYMMAGDKESKKAGKLLKDYNNQDVQLLYDVYMKFRPFIKNHPNLAVVADREACPKCLGRNFSYNGMRYTNTMAYRRVFCIDCRSWFKERLADKDMQTKPFLVN